MKSFLAYRLTCINYSFVSIVKTYYYSQTKIEQYIKNEKRSNIYKYFYTNETCSKSYRGDTFKIHVKANFKFNSKIKEVLLFK